MKITNFLLFCPPLLFIAGLLVGLHYNPENIPKLAPNTTPPVPSPAPLDPTNQSAIILPSLTQSLPLVFSSTLTEAIIQQHLLAGAVVLPQGTSFGEAGNVVITAHSSGPASLGPYRFAFARLAKLERGTEYTINTPQASYQYRVYAKEVVWPHQVDHLPQDKRSTVTLVTCWPLGSDQKRLLVHSELVSIDRRI